MASSISRSLSADNRRKVVSEMSNFHTLAWVAVAFAIHLVVIGATSVGYIRDRWIDPSGAAARAQAAQATDVQKPVEPTANATPASPAPPQSAQAGSGGDDEKKLLEQHKDNPEVKSITQTAKPNEIPKTPTHDGFNLDDTSLK